MTDQPIPHSRIRELTSEARALAATISDGDLDHPDIIRVIAKVLCAAYNTGCTDTRDKLDLGNWS